MRVKQLSKGVHPEVIFFSSSDWNWQKKSIELYLIRVFRLTIDEMLWRRRNACLDHNVSVKISITQSESEATKCKSNLARPWDRKHPFLTCSRAAYDTGAIYTVSSPARVLTFGQRRSKIEYWTRFSILRVEWMGSMDGGKPASHQSEAFDRIRLFLRLLFVVHRPEFFSFH